LACQLDALEAARIRVGDPDEPGRPSLTRIARQLRHTGSMHGFPELSRAALRLEEAAFDDWRVPFDTLCKEIEHAIKEGTGETTVLVAEGDPDTLRIIELTLSAPSRSVLTFEHASEAWELLERREVALVVLGRRLADTDGRDLLLHLREHAWTAQVPVVMMLQQRDSQVAAECFALGADFVLEQPFDPATLSSVVSTRLRRSYSLRSRDSLTGLPNREAVTNAYRRLQTFYDFQQAPLCAACLDIDRLHKINELQGPAAGDDALVRVTDTLRQTLRSHHIVGRWVSDRFVLLFPDTRREEAVQVVDQTLYAIKHTFFESERGQQFSLSCSAGLAEVAEDQRSLDDVMTEAVEYLEQAQQRGRGRLAAPQHSPAAATRPTLLLVEDNPATASIAISLLEHDGFVVTHHTDGTAVFEGSYEEQLAIIGTRVGDRGRQELLSQMREHPTYARLPILMLAPSQDSRDVAESFKRGADGYVAQPFSGAELLARVRRLLHRLDDEKRGTEASE
jgi:diguanylate cyclase (GGDEF)-like protein